MSNATKLISFVIPCYRSERTIEGVVHEIQMEMERLSADYEIIMVDDCSPDNLLMVLRKLASNSNMKVISFAKNFGQHAGMMAGIRASKGDYVVILDDDGQCPVDHLQELIDPLKQGYDISFAKYGRQKQSVFKNLCSDIHVLVTDILTEKPKNIQMTNFIAISRNIAEEIGRYTGPYPVISGLIFRSSNKVANVPMPERARAVGTTTYNLRRLFELWLNTFTAFSIKPLRFATIVGIFASLSGVVYAVLLIIRRLYNSNIAIGWTSTIAVNLIIGGLILFVLGIIGEYIGRIYMSMNATPQYVIRETVNLEDADFFNQVE